MEETELVTKILTTYGPLGLGWVFAILLYLRTTTLQDRMLDVIVASTQAMTLLTAKIEGGER